MPATRRGVCSAVMLAILVLVASGCASLPSLDGRTVSTVIMDTADTRLGRSVQDDVAANPGKSGIYPLDVPQDAFAARVLLARAAERSLDVQYYIWHGDTTGYQLLDELWNAAERGVRVRLLLDDNGTAGLDDAIAALDSHPGIEVRLFNPFVNRSFRALGYLTDFGRLNRRMHNKSFTADSQATIVGGRNIGDEYFGAGDGVLFEDLDVVAVGTVVAEVSRVFDDYWSSDSAYPAGSILGPAGPDSMRNLQAKIAAVRATPEAIRYDDALRRTRLIEELLGNTLKIEWVPAQLVHDEPSKTLGKAQASELLVTRLGQAIGPAERELDVISPYFVPGKEGARQLAAYPERGVALRILTNSLAATDVSAVHAGYAKRRKVLLRSGARLFELKPESIAGAGEPKKQSSVFGGSVGGSSAASLHAKSFAIDRQRLFVGSFNLDLRSIGLNTEMGLVIESPTLAGKLSGWFDQRLPTVAYEVRFGADGDSLEWVEQTGAGEVRYTREPKTGFFKRLGVAFMALLPIDWML